MEVKLREIRFDPVWKLVVRFTPPSSLDPGERCIGACRWGSMH